MEIARGKYILLLNSDTKVIGVALKKLVLFLDSHPKVAVVTARLVYPDLSDQGVARNFPTPINAFYGRKSILTKFFPNNRFSKKYLVSRMHTTNVPFEVDWVSGACLMVKKKVIEEIGPMDEKFFMYWEDVDLCFRIKQKAWKIFCVPEAVVIHYEGKSTPRKHNNRLIVEFSRSAYRFFRKHQTRSFFEIMNFVAIFGLTLRTLVLLALNVFKVRRDNNKRGYISHESS
jgi:GT2 family glycosyltransferase